jgi:hypothetical protein
MARVQEQVSALVNGSDTVFSIEKDVPLDDIYLAHVPGEFGLDPMLLFKMLEVIQGDEVLAIPYPLQRYALKKAISGDNTVDPQKAVVYNVPDPTGSYPEEPKLFMCSVPAFVGPKQKYTLYTHSPSRVVQTAPMAFVGCVGSRAGGFLR